eukprot:s125_g17.t5
MQSSLYKENNFELGHSEVWGSWYDASAERWGYACCRALQRSKACVANAAPAQDLEEGGDLEAGAPACLDDLQPRSSFAEADLFALRWLQAALREYRRQHQLDAACASRFGRLQPEEVERSLVTLLQTLQASCQSYWKGEEVHVWSVGHNKWFKTGRVVAVRETEEGGRAVGSVLVTFVEMADSRPSRKWVSPANIPAVLRKAAEVKISRDDLDKIVRIAELCAEREYHAASQVYLELTVGHGRWHGDLSEKHEKGEEVAEIGSQANQRTQLDPVLAQRWEKLQKTEFPVEDDIDPVLAKRWSQQQELVDSGLYEAEIGSAADKSTKLDPTLAKHWAAAHERALAGKGIPDPEEVGPKADFSRSGFSRTNAMCYTLGILPQWMDCRKDTELAKRFAKLQRQAQRNEGGEAERCQLQFSAGESKEHEVSTEGSGSAIGRLQWSAVVLADFTIDLEVCAVVRIPPEMESTETIVTSVLFKFSNSFSWFTGKEVELVFLRD